MTQKKSDTTINDIHQIRREISDRFGGDAFAISEDAARRQAASNRPVWTSKHDEQFDAAEVRVPRVPVVDQTPHPADQ